MEADNSIYLFFQASDIKSQGLENIALLQIFSLALSDILLSAMPYKWQIQQMEYLLSFS